MDALMRSGQPLWFDSYRRWIRSTGLAALMMAHDLTPWTVANVSARLYSNPYVDDRVPRELSSFGYADAAGRDLQLHRGLRAIRDVMGSAEDWPSIHEVT